MNRFDHSLSRRLAPAATVAALWLPACGQAQVTAADAMTNLLQKKLVYDLSLTVSQAHIVEFTPIDVAYTVSVGVTGRNGPDPVPTSVDVCPAQIRPETTCAHIAQALPGRTYRGSIKAMAPWAGANAELRAVVMAPGPVVAEIARPRIVRTGYLSLPVYARYEVAIEGFRVLTTRSTSTDTDWITLQALVTATPPDPSATADACSYAGITWCIFRRRYGDAGDGYHPVSNVRVGPYDLIPEVQADLRFLFDIDNTGDNPAQAIGEGVANGFSKVGAVILMAYGAAAGNGDASGFAQQLSGVMDQFHSAAFASCDGPVAVDRIVLGNRTIPAAPKSSLDALTRANGVFRAIAPSPMSSYDYIDGDFRCDRRGSHYQVNYAVFRTSWVPWANQFTY